MTGHPRRPAAHCTTAPRIPMLAVGHTGFWPRWATVCSVALVRRQRHAARGSGGRGAGRTPSQIFSDRRGQCHRQNAGDRRFGWIGGRERCSMGSRGRPTRQRAKTANCSPLAPRSRSNGQICPRIARGPFRSLRRISGVCAILLTLSRRWLCCRLASEPPVLARLGGAARFRESPFVGVKRTCAPRP